MIVSLTSRNERQRSFEMRSHDMVSVVMMKRKKKWRWHVVYNNIVKNLCSIMQFKMFFSLRDRKHTYRTFGHYSAVNPLLRNHWAFCWRIKRHALIKIYSNSPQGGDIYIIVQNVRMRLQKNPMNIQNMNNEGTQCRTFL